VGIFALNHKDLQTKDLLAGAPGFEPGNGGIKIPVSPFRSTIILKNPRISSHFESIGWTRIQNAPSAQRRLWCFLFHRRYRRAHIVGLFNVGMRISELSRWLMTHTPPSAMTPAFCWPGALQVALVPQLQKTRSGDSVVSGSIVATEPASAVASQQFALALPGEYDVTAGVIRIERGNCQYAASGCDACDFIPMAPANPALCAGAVP
jgi:hypothetical protein